MNHPAGDAHNRAVGFNIPYHHRSCSDAGVGTNFYGSEHFGASSDHHVRAQRGVTFAVIFARASKGDSLIEQTAITHPGCFTDHHPHAVVNEDAMANAGPWVDLNTSQPSANLAQQSCRQFER